MFTRIEIPPALIALALRQGGVFSSTQARCFGVTKEASRRMHRNGNWHRVAPGVTSVLQNLPWIGYAWAGVLQCADGVLGGAAAGHLYALCEPPSVISVWTITQVRHSEQRWRFRQGQRRGSLEPARVRIEEAALEMCERESETGVLAVLAGAVGTRRTTPARLRSLAVGVPNLRHRRLILEVLDDVADGIESPLEHRYLVDVERAHGLPVGERQVSISRGTRSDVGYLEYQVLVELDGRVWHAGLAATTDMQRDNQHLLSSFITLRYGWDAVVRQPCSVAHQVTEALIQRGWSGTLRRCPRCG